MIMPNFLIIGAAKSGTSSLLHYLKQHHQVYIAYPKFEPKFFALEGQEPDFRGPGDKGMKAVTEINKYIDLFQGVSDEIAIGEKSPLYLYSEKAPERIKHYLPNVKLIAILRHPADRAYSSFLHLIRDGREPITNFAKALQEEEERIQDNYWILWHYKNGGFYSSQLKRYYDRFDLSQIKVYLYEDLCLNPIYLMQDIYQFLGVDNTFFPDTSVKYNQSGTLAGKPKNKFLHKFLSKPHPVKSILKPFLGVRLREGIVNKIRNHNISTPEFPPELRKQLIQLYREDILKLQDLIERDLSKWLV